MNEPTTIVLRPAPPNQEKITSIAEIAVLAAGPSGANRPDRARLRQGLQCSGGGQAMLAAPLPIHPASAWNRSPNPADKPG